MYGLTVTSAPAAEPVSTADAKLWLKVDTSADDTLIDSLVVAARQEVEAWCNVTLINTTYALTLDAWPADGVIYLPRGPVSSVTSIAYLDSNGDSQTWASSNYVVDLATPSPRIARADGVTFPTLDNRIAAVTVTYVAGYGAAATAIPSAIITAIKLLVGDYYENRQGQVGQALHVNPTAARLLEFYRNRNAELGAY